MNFLAHLYLSQNNTNIMIGNFIADHIRGNKFEHFDPEIQQGILLHREIDTFTDAHKIVRKSKRRLHERYGHYDGVIIDIFFDHFLAKNWSQYSAIPLDVYTNSVYQLFQEKQEDLPEKSQQFIKYMVEYDILYNYQFLDPIDRVLNGMNRRTKGKSQMNLAIEDLKEQYQNFEDDFSAFFEDLRIFSEEKLLSLRGRMTK
ncbi:acyl carrier protein phosphodiesterase [Lutibacter sp. Hel_I_33_5]|nr:acyl carrier protein phosphodiesterase [Lutibacter sp. Hel_I_33_5]